MQDFRDLMAYRKAFDNAMLIYEITKKFPPNEEYALTNQIRRSSRSICSNIAEAYRKRYYPKDFLSKIRIADAENSETIVWLDFAKRCGYLSKEKYLDLSSTCHEVGRLLHYMITHPDKFGVKSAN